jgi:hypothetical protein
MPMILINCPVTQELLPTNMSMERESFELSDLSRNSTPCPHCGGIHIWDKKDAWLEGQAVPNGDPRRTSV